MTMTDVLLVKCDPCFEWCINWAMKKTNESQPAPQKIQAILHLMVPSVLFYIIVSNLIYHPICFARATARISASSA
jgi:hypothetical protein